MNQSILTVTGHRPQKISRDLFEWDKPLSERYIDFFMKYILNYVQETDSEVICRSGMALGIDTLFAIAAIRLKKSGYLVKLECCIPCIKQYSKWNPSAVDLYHKILAEADLVTYVSKEPYTAWCMNDRNEYMVDNGCNRVLAVWDGTKGGTGNCVQYAIKQQVPIIVVTPIKQINQEFEMKKIQ